MISGVEREATAQRHGHEWPASSEARPGPGVPYATCLRTLYGYRRPETPLSPAHHGGREADAPDGNEYESTDSRRGISLAGSYSAGLPARGYDWFQWRPSVRRQPVRMYPVR